MIKIELTFTTIAEAAAFLAGSSAPNVSATPVLASGKQSTTGASTRSSKTQSESAEKTTSAATQAEGNATAGSSEATGASTGQAGDDATAEEPKVEYPDLQKAVMALVAVSTEEMKKIVDSFGIKTFKGSDAAIWPAALKKINDRLAELKTEEGMA